MKLSTNFGRIPKANIKPYHDYYNILIIIQSIVMLFGNHVRRYLQLLDDLLRKHSHGSQVQHDSVAASINAVLTAPSIIGNINSGRDSLLEYERAMAHLLPSSSLPVATAAVSDAKEIKQLPLSNSTKDQ
jgi:hypothetical protein